MTFTVKRLGPLPTTGNWEADGPDWLKRLVSYLDSLEQPGALNHDRNPIRASEGIKFPATQVDSTDVNTFDDYKEVNSWTPADASGAALALTIHDATCVKEGRLVVARAFITYPATASGAAAKISGFPYAAAKRDVFAIRTNGAGGGVVAQILSTTAEFFAVGSVAITNANLTGADVVFTAIYQV